MKKLLIRIAVTFTVILTLLFGGAYLFLVFKGKDLVVKQVENIIQRKVTIGSIKVALPLKVEIRELDVAGLMSADYVSISPGILSLLRGNIAFNNVEIARPEFTYERKPSEDGSEEADSSAGIMIPGLPLASEPPPDAPSGAKKETNSGKKMPLRLILKRVHIKDGTVNIIDYSVAKGGIKFTIKNLNFTLNNLYLVPRSAVGTFELKGDIPWNGDKEMGRFESRGWFNLYRKDMRASVNLKGIDGIALYPYYAQWVDLEKTRIQKAKLNFTSDINSLNNNLTAKCHLELTDIVRRSLGEEEHEDKASKIANTIFTVFQALNQGKIVFDFTLRTRMNMPQISLADIQSAFEVKIAKGLKATSLKPEDILKTPAYIVKGTVKGAADVSRGLLAGTFALGKELKEAIQVSFKREKDTD